MIQTLRVFGWIVWTAYTAAASGSDSKVKFDPEIPAFKAALIVASFAASDQIAGTVKM